jgi:hypothetical protein
VQAAVIFHNVQQNEEAWQLLRAQKPTSSKLAVIMAHYGKPFGDPAQKYAVEIAVEQITGQPCGSGFSNDHMERGHEEEPAARMLYEEETFSKVTNGGFFDHGFFGCSPDGLVGTDGVVEIKSAIPSTHYDRIRRQSYDSAYKWQLVGNLKFTGRQWIDFISYCSSFPVGRRLFVCRLTRDECAEEFKMIDSRLAQFLELVAEAKQTILASDYFLTAKRTEAA